MSESHSVMSNSFEPMDCSQTGSSVHGIIQARILEWIVISLSRGSSQPRNRTRISHVYCIGKQVLHREYQSWDKSKYLAPTTKQVIQFEKANSFSACLARLTQFLWISHVIMNRKIMFYNATQMWITTAILIWDDSNTAVSSLGFYQDCF